MDKTFGTEPVILLVEDSEADSLLLQQAFARAGMRRPLQIVRDGIDAMSYLLGRGEFFDREKYPMPSILMVDINMPRLNGLELLTWLRTQTDFGHLMVIVWTGDSKIEQINHAYHMGANSYLVKPTGHEELQELISCFYRYWVVHNCLPSPPQPPKQPVTLARD
ncbi:MAG: response regulator [Verrucomicrobia subdivision 3 bacterium]|nr:response regulator [Limisphaerales bacterium]